MGLGTRGERSIETATVVELDGDATDVRTIMAFHARSISVLDRRAGRVRLDLRRVERADTKLVATLVSLVSRATAAGRELEIVPSDAVRTVLGLCRLDGLAACAAG